MTQATIDGIADVEVASIEKTLWAGIKKRKRNDSAFDDETGIGAMRGSTGANGKAKRI